MSNNRSSQVVARLGFEVPDYFGGCPECGRLDDWFNVGRDHWCVCHEHKNKWTVGSNLFSSWRDETQAVWLENERLLRDYLGIKPLSPTNPSDYADSEAYERAMDSVLAELKDRQRLWQQFVGMRL